MSDKYGFRYVFPPGPMEQSFPATVEALLDEAGIDYEIKHRDWGTFIAYRVIVSKAAESAAAFRLMCFKAHLRSEGPTSAHHATVRPSYWLHERVKPNAA